MEEETKKKTMLFAPRFSRSHERREEEKTKHTVKEKIEKRASEDSSLRSRVRYWNCDTSDNGDKNVDQQVKAILGVLTGSSKEDKEPTDRVGIVICGGEKKEEDFSLFQALMKALMIGQTWSFSGFPSPFLPQSLLYPQSQFSHPRQMISSQLCLALVLTSQGAV